MIYLPPLRWFLVPALASVCFIILYRSLPSSGSLPAFVLHSPPIPPPGLRIPVKELQKPLPVFNTSSNYLSPPSDYFYTFQKPVRGNQTSADSWQPALDGNLTPLFQCSKHINARTGHIRLSNIVQNISEIASDTLKPERRVFWNPTVIALPHWSHNQYLVVSRILTDGNHQENVLCEANVCYTGSAENARPGEKPCTADDLKVLGPAGGLRCATSPVKLSVPPTPAEKCEGKFGSYVDIPGFHDPRIFWSGKGEPLMMVNTQSRYACFGLWIIDLRSLYQPLQTLLGSSPDRPSLGPLKSYPTLTELTRNPPSTRVSIEKNWLLFFPSNGESYVQYELPSYTKASLDSSSASPNSDHSTTSSSPSPPFRGRTFAKLLGSGLTTTNLTDPLEQPCLHDLTSHDRDSDSRPRRGTWHQATNSLRLILCERIDPKCHATPANTVFFALVHRKFPNELKLPLRYERYFLVWAATPPFNMLGISQHPILLANETATGWTAEDNWAGADLDVSGGTMKMETDTPPQSPPPGMDSALRKRMTNNSVNETSRPPFSTPSSFHGSNEETKPLWAYFTYTVSMAYAWGRQPRGRRPLTHGDEAEDMHVGYLDDEVVLGIGVDDAGQAFARVKAGDLVDCMKACPGRGEGHKEDDTAGGDEKEH